MTRTSASGPSTSHVKRLRKKFAQLDPEFDEIDTVYGLGYRYREHQS